MSEVTPEVLALTNLLNRIQDDVMRLKLDIRKLGSSSTTVSVTALRAAAHSALSGVTSNQHHTKNHAGRHAPTEADPLLLDEDDLASDSETLGVTQQSIAAFIAGLPDNWNASTISQVEAEAGTETIDRKWTAERVKQAIAALGGGGAALVILALAGVGNAAYMPCVLESSSKNFSVMYMNSASGFFKFTGLPGGAPVYKLVVPTVKNTQKLYINAFRIGVNLATVGTKVTQVRIFGLVYNTLTLLATENLDRTTPGSYTTTFGAIDCSSYDNIIMIVNTLIAGANLLALSGQEVKCYYDT